MVHKIVALGGVGREPGHPGGGQWRLRDLGDTTCHLLLPADCELQGGQGVVGDPACSGDGGLAEELRDRGEATCGVGRRRAMQETTTHP